MGKSETITDHLAQPGQLYWDFKCLVCEEPVVNHIGLLRFLWRKLVRR